MRRRRDRYNLHTGCDCGRCTSVNGRTRLRNPLDPVEHDLISGVIVTFGGARTFVIRKMWAPDLDLHAKLSGAALDHAIRIDPVHSLARSATRRAKKGGSSARNPSQKLPCPFSRLAKATIDLCVRLRVPRGHRRIYARFIQLPFVSDWTAPYVGTDCSIDTLYSIIVSSLWRRH
jgi:hypothetical protein